MKSAAFPYIGEGGRIVLPGVVSIPAVPGEPLALIFLDLRPYSPHTFGNASPERKMDGSSRSSWGNTAVLTAALAVCLYLFNSSQDLRRIERVSTTVGEYIPLFSKDSSVVILFTTAECPISRVNANWYRELGTRLRGEGVAFRTVVRSNSISARQFARVLGDAATVPDDGTLFRAAGVQSVPVLKLYDDQRRLLKSWSSPTASIGIENVLHQVATPTSHQSKR